MEMLYANMGAATLSRTTLYEMTVTMVGFIPNFCINDIEHNDTQHTQCHLAQCCGALGYITILLYYYITILLYYYITILLYYYITILLYYYITILLYYYITILLS